MRPLILISGYLAKDILRRWLETPAALFSRFLLCASLCLFYVFLSAFFLLAERKIQKKIDSMGLGTIIFKAFDSERPKDRAQAGNLFSPLSKKGIFVPFEHTFLLGEMHGDKTCRVILFDEQSMPGLVQLSENFAKVREPYFVVSKGFPESFRVPVILYDYVLEPEVIAPPPIFDLLSKDSPILFISKEFSRSFGEGMNQEAFLFIGDENLD